MEIAEEPEADKVVANKPEEDRTVEVVVSESEESVPKDYEKEKGNAVISSKEDEDSVFLEESQPIHMRSHRAKILKKRKFI